MLQMLKKKLKDQRGLTLIELLAVIVILGIISAIAVPNIGKVIDNSKESAIRADAIQILNAAKLYAADNGVPVDDTTTANVDEGELDKTKLANYVDSVTTFASFTVTFSGNTPSISGTGNKGGKSITFTDATVSIIDSATKGDTTIQATE